MVDQGVTTFDLPQQNAAYSLNDRIMFIYAAEQANTVNSVAQTATITIQNFFAGDPAVPILVSNLTFSNISQTDPANSVAITVKQGTLFFSNSFGYIAIANNYLVRWPLNSF